MTIKKQAKELYLRYDFWARPMMLDKADNKHRRKYYIQQLALICVDEKIVFLGELFLKTFIEEKNYRVEMGKLFEERQEIKRL